MTNQLLTEIPKPVKTRHHLAQAVGIRGLKTEIGKVNGFNAKIAVLVTNIVGSMWCAWAFCLIALTSLPAILVGTGWISKTVFPSWLITASLISIVAWVAQTFIQLVLLSVIMVGQNVQAIASDARSQHTYEDTVKIIDALDLNTQGGIKDLHDAICAHIDSVLAPKAPATKAVAVKKK